MRLEISTVMLQWAAGGLLFAWVTTRHRVVGLGYGWLLRGVYGVFALAALAASVAGGRTGIASTVFRASCVAAVAGAGIALAVSVARRRAGVRGQRERATRVRARVGTTTDGGRSEGAAGPEGESDAEGGAEVGAEFPPVLDLVAPVCAIVGLFAAATSDGGPYALTLFRLLAGAALLGVSSDAMLLGHWYLVQPGLGREPLRELVAWLALAWAVDVVAFLVPTGVVSVFTGAIDDGYDGLLGWVWLASAVTTIGLAGATWAALKERAYSAVMAATGLLYLAILTAFGTDLVARALLNPT
ncbi:MAG TPA: hypothetical protein VFF40_12280 [Acidimicrobiia bacterium]|nr:hypothetical protein [Acidimicrobiia bacterium]